ncbi:MAG: hypothetical protein AAFZ15_03245 [Bacteroidota bacterium]
MKTALLTCALALCFFLNNSDAQTLRKYTRLDFFFGLCFHPYQLSDPGGQIKDELVDGFSGGVEVTVDYSDVFSVGGGLIIKPQNYSVNLEGSQSDVGTEGMNTLQLPLCLQARKHIGPRKKAIAYLQGGGALGFNLNYRDGVIGGGGSGNLRRTVDVGLKRIFPLLFTGAGIEAPVYIGLTESETKVLRLGFSARRFFGFTDIMRVHAEYMSGGNSFMATQNYQGGYWMFNLHVVFALEH